MAKSTPATPGPLSYDNTIEQGELDKVTADAIEQLKQLSAAHAGWVEKGVRLRAAGEQGGQAGLKREQAELEQPAPA